MVGVGPVAMPVPERSMAGVLPLMLPAMNSDAVRIPGAAGVKVTWTVQRSPAGNVVPQLLVSAKSLLFSPPTVIAKRLSALVPVLVSCTGCAAPGAPIFRWPKFSLAVDNAGGCAWEELEAPS